VKRVKTVLEAAFEEAMLRSGKSERWYGRRLAEPGATPRQVDNALANLRAHLRRGGASFNYGARVVSLIEISPQSKLHDLLLKPRACWPGWAITSCASNSYQEATGTPGKSGSVAS
jgi:hypothetical protein